MRGCQPGAPPTTTYMSRIFHSVKTTIAFNTSRTKKIRSPKTRHCGLRQKKAVFQPRMLATDGTRCSSRRSCHTDQRRCKAKGHFTSLSRSARSLKCGTSEREWGSTASTPSRNGLFIPRLKVKGSQTTVHAKRW